MAITITGKYACVLTGFGLASAFILSLGTPAWSASNIVINEVMWDGEEYVELYNAGSDLVDLTGWQLTRQKSVDSAEEVLVNFSAGEVINGQGYYLIAKKVSAVSVSADKLSPSLVLHNDGDLLRLRDGNEAVVDTANRFGAWFAGQNTTSGVAMERIDPASDGGSDDSWQDASSSLGGRQGTPGQANSSPEQGKASPPVPTTTSSPAYSNSIVINEFLPNPVGNDTAGEFIELYNSGLVSVDISGWGLDDGDTGSKKYIFPAGTVLSSESYTALPWAQTKITLNNNLDQIVLTSPDGVMRAQAQYSDNAPEGASYNYFDEGDYRLSSTITAGSANIITSPPAATPKLTPTAKPTGTPNLSASKTPVPTVAGVYNYSRTVYINEFLPNPTGEDTQAEFIEIINLGAASINLTGWQLDDEAGGSKPYTLPAGTTLKAGAVKSWKRSETALALNNEGDSVRLLDPAGQVLSSYTYTESAPEGQSFSRTPEGSYLLSSSVTEGTANIISTAVAGSTKGTTAKPGGNSANPSASLYQGAGQLAVSGAAATAAVLGDSISQPGVAGGDDVQVTANNPATWSAKRIAGIVTAVVAILLIIVNVVFSGEPIWKFGNRKSAIGN